MSDPKSSPQRDKARLAGRAVIAACALAAAALVPRAAFAKTTRLECELTRVQTKTGANFEVAAESQLLAITFDEDAKTLAVERAGKTWPLDHVTITPIAMTGYADNFSLGVDRSSWSVVLQTYGSNSINSEFGICAQSGRLKP